MVRKQRQTLKGTRYFVNEQFPREVVERRRRLVPRMNAARQDGHKAWITYDTLYIDGKPVKSQEFEQRKLNILSWNVHGLTDSKIDNDDFVKILVKNDIIFLYETWTNNLSQCSLNGYSSNNFYRKFKHRNAKRSSGGIVVYYKDSMKNCIEIIQNHVDTLIWLKLDHNYFQLDKDVYICGAYIWGEDSPAYNIGNIDLFETLEHDINYYSEWGTVFITGDLNSRVGVSQDCVEHDRYTSEKKKRPMKYIG